MLTAMLDNACLLFLWRSHPWVVDSSSIETLQDLSEPVDSSRDEGVRFGCVEVQNLQAQLFSMRMPSCASTAIRDYQLHATYAL